MESKLLKCTYCGREYSPSRETKCSGCGAGIESAKVHPNNKQVEGNGNINISGVNCSNINITVFK